MFPCELFPQNLQNTEAIIAMLPFVRKTSPVCLKQQHSRCLGNAWSRSGQSTKVKSQFKNHRNTDNSELFRYRDMGYNTEMWSSAHKQ